MKKIMIILMLLFTQLSVIKAIDAEKPVTVNPAIELINVIQYLADRTYYTETEYSKSIEPYFKAHKNHPAVLHLKNLLEDQGSWDIGPSLGSVVKWDTNLSSIYPYNEGIVKRFKGIDSLNLFMKEVRNFRKVTHFDQFLTSQQANFTKAIHNFTAVLSGSTDYISTLQNYMRMDGLTFKFVISFLTPCGGVSPLNNVPGLRLSIMGVCNGGLEFDAKSIQSLAWHEFNHPTVNPIIEKHSKEVNISAILFNKISRQLKWADGLEKWEGAVKEHIIRAIVARLILKTQGKEAAEVELIRQEQFFGFAYIRPIFHQLATYEQYPDRYPTFESFIPELITVFTNLAENLNVVRLPLYKIRQEKPVVFVLPTLEKGKYNLDTIKAAVNQIISNSSWQNVLMVTDIEALKMDPIYSFIIMGTPEGNLYLKSLLHKLPFKIDGNGITGSIEQVGKNLGLTAIIPHPDNPERSLIINTAQTNETLNLNAFTFGYEYVIWETREKKPKFLRSGAFKRNEKGYILE